MRGRADNDDRDTVERRSTSAVCFATAAEFDGCDASCRNAAAVLGGSWTRLCRDADPPPEVFASDLLVLSSWHRRYETILERRSGPIVVRWHSTILQTELGQEAQKIARLVNLLDEGVISGLAVSDPEFVSALDRDAVVYLPEVCQTDYVGVAPAPLHGVNISLFGAPHWRKNLFVQSAAFALAMRGSGTAAWTLHLNSQTLLDDGFAGWLRAARIPYVDHGWLERADYLSLVAAMDVGLCATLCEGYCYVAADHVKLDVPVVSSPAVACLAEACSLTTPDRVAAVADALTQAFSDGEAIRVRQRRVLGEGARRRAALAQSALVDLESRARTRSAR